MRSSESYRLANNFEKSSHLSRCRLSKGTAECWAIWEIWLRMSFISSVLWTHWHKSCSLYSGKLGAASSGHTKDCLRWSVRCLALCWLEGWQIAINVRHQKRGRFQMGSVCHSPTYGCTGPRSNRKQSQTETAWVPETEPSTGSLQKGISPNWHEKGPVNLHSPVPYTEHPLFPLHLLGVRKSYLTCSGVCFPRTKPPLTLWGQERPKEDQRVMWSGS